MQSRRNFWQSSGWGNHWISLSGLHALGPESCVCVLSSCLDRNKQVHVCILARGYDASEKNKDLLLIQEFTCL